VLQASKGVDQEIILFCLLFVMGALAALGIIANFLMQNFGPR